MRFVLTAMLLSAGAVIADDRKDDREAFQGTWTIAHTKKGDKKDKEPVTAPTVVFEGGKYRIKEGDKVVEAGIVIQSIRAAEETYRGENQVYLDVSKANGWYPSDSYGENPRSFAAPGHADYAKWRQLGVQVQQPVKFRYLVNAGSPDGKLPDLHISGKAPAWKMTDPWYVIQARADYDGDGVFCTALASSLNHEVYVEQEGE